MFPCLMIFSRFVHFWPNQHTFFLSPRNILWLGEDFSGSQHSCFLVKIRWLYPCRWFVLQNLIPCNFCTLILPQRYHNISTVNISTNADWIMWQALWWTVTIKRWQQHVPIATWQAVKNLRNQNQRGHYASSRCALLQVVDSNRQNRDKQSCKRTGLQSSLLVCGSFTTETIWVVKEWPNKIILFPEWGGWGLNFLFR